VWSTFQVTCSLKVTFHPLVIWADSDVIHCSHNSVPGVLNSEPYLSHDGFGWSVMTWKFMLLFEPYFINLRCVTADRSVVAHLGS
jgi:hypothetical protein